jgi:hypothetical protein
MCVHVETGHARCFSRQRRDGEETLSPRMTRFGLPRSLSMRDNDLEASSFKSKRSMKSSPLE